MSNISVLKNQNNLDKLIKQSNKLFIDNKIDEKYEYNIYQEVDLDKTEFIFRSTLFNNKKIDLNPPKVHRQLAFSNEIDLI
tara:strand:- start:7 stop:249 length:243 start_codon:yes stop_codon:yes gene_type:complete